MRSWIIGSLTDCDIWVESPTVSGKHCRLTQRGESFLLEDLQSSNGTFVADERITGPRIVRRGEDVTLGKNTPLPWHAVSVSITIGRSPENDIVIPMDTVSGRHARLEREGKQVFLVDVGSTNGTAINDPLTKITRAPLAPGDFVFFGTHRVAACDLLAALPADLPRQTTKLESQRPAELRERASEVPQTSMSSNASTSARESTAPHSSASWLIGVVLSVVVLATMLGGRWILRNDKAVADNSPAAQKVTDSASPSPPIDPVAALPPTSIQPTPAVNHSSAMPAQPDETTIRGFDEAVALIGLRVGRQPIIDDATVWSFRDNAVICPTAVIERLGSIRAKEDGGDESLVVFTRTKALAILAHKPGIGGAAGFSVAILGGSLDAHCSVLPDQDVFKPIPGQKLALVYGWCKNDEPATIERRFTYLTIERIERSEDGRPLHLHCSCEGERPAAIGAPVFDASGHVVGCVEPSAGQELRVVPMPRLISLLQSNP